MVLESEPHGLHPTFLVRKIQSIGSMQPIDFVYVKALGHTASGVTHGKRGDHGERRNPRPVG